MGRFRGAERLAYVTEASTQFFAGLHNLRVDRSQSFRDLNGEKTDGVSQMLRDIRNAEMPALKAGLVALAKADIADGQKWLTQIGQSVDRLEKLHAESAAALSQQKATRRPDLAKELFDHHDALIATLDKVSSQLANAVKLDDSYVDQLMLIKQLAWIVRNAGGDSSVLISNGLGGAKLPPDVMTKYAASVAATDTAWAALGGVASGLPLPPQFAEAIDKANREFFAPDYAKLRMDTLKTLVAGEQATGLDEIKKALSQMNEATQRNSTLVEENAATSVVLERQAKAMDEQVALFQVEGEPAASGDKQTSRPAAAPRVVAAKRSRAA